MPFVNGWFGAYGRFRSDDLKIGEIAAFTGSSTSALYFPEEVETEAGSTPIACMVVEEPCFAGGSRYAVQQGAGMVVTKSTPQREYAAVEFLKWFTREENNVAFSCTSAYLPVKKEAFSEEKLDAVATETGMAVSGALRDTLGVCFHMMADTQLYTNKAFDNGTAARKVLEYHLGDKAAADREVAAARLAQGLSQEEAVAEFVTDEAFDAWYDEFTAALRAAVEQG